LILHWTESALKDKDSHIDYIAQDNVSAAIDMGDEIERQISLLAEHPKLGRVGRIKGTRELVIQGTPYIAAYKISSDCVYVLRILHGAMNWNKQFTKL
jgi:addiction module toxin, RelE/StbE family